MVHIWQKGPSGPNLMVPVGPMMALFLDVLWYSKDTISTKCKIYIEIQVKQIKLGITEDKSSCHTL